MERYEFEMIPVPAETLDAVGITPGVTVEAFADGSRIVIQKAPKDDFCEAYNDDCEGCPYCCPCCGECLKEQMNECFGEDDGDE